MDQILEKLVLANLKGTFEIWNFFFFYLAHWKFFILRSLSIRRTILSPPLMVQQKNVLNKNLTFMPN